jgi:trk system potassium uptake protein TrkH
MAPSRRLLSIRLPPPALLALLYAGLIAAGAGLLMLPVAQAQPFGWGDALFTATSAVTVTGLVVLDTGTAFTGFGQGVLLVLMQLGGLGLMSFAVLVLSALGLPVGLSQTSFLREDLNQTSVAGLTRLVWLILRVVVLCELVGAAVLATVFVPEFGWRAGLWSAVFHAVSAFNNAGFTLYPDSLTRWVGHPVINLAVPTLFVVGGIGFSVLAELARHRRWGPCSLHTKLMLSGTAGLAVLSVTLVAVLEWHNPATLGALAGPGEKLGAAWFQAMTTRTAGFNTIDIVGLHDGTALMMMTLMLIGGGSTSTAGGIKVTTFLVLLIATVAFFRRARAPSAFGRSLGFDELLKVLALVTVAMLLVMLATFALAVTQAAAFVDIAFEVTSAFGTTGLSRGLTGQLDGFGRAVLCLLMFLGRVGPLTLGFFLATRIPPRVRYPEGRIYLG